MINLNQTNYPFFSYVPSKFAAGIFAVLVYISLIGWLIQSLKFKCRPRMHAILISVTHLTVFIDMVLRGTLPIEVYNTGSLYRVTAPMLNVPPRLLLISNYQLLIELRGKKPRGILDRVIDILVPVGAITGDILLTVANEFSFKPKHLYSSFYFRQASAVVILALAILFYVVWYLAVPQTRQLYVLPLLAVSSVAVLMDAIYILTMSNIPFFFVLTQNEFWYYVGHLIPIAIALFTWTILHPSRILPPKETEVSHDETVKELLPQPPAV